MIRTETAEKLVISMGENFPNLEVFYHHDTKKNGAFVLWKARLLYVKGSRSFLRDMCSYMGAEGKLKYRAEYEPPVWECKLPEKLARTCRIRLFHPKAGTFFLTLDLRPHGGRCSLATHINLAERSLGVLLPGKFDRAFLERFLGTFNWTNLRERAPTLFQDAQESLEETLRLSWRGVDYPVALGGEHSEVRRGVLHLAVRKGASITAIRRAYRSFLEADFRTYLGPMVKEVSEAMGVHPADWTLLPRARSIWGKCRMPSRTLYFHFLLVAQDEAFARYVVVHECAHLREMNHGPRFWALVEHHCPGYRQILNRQGQPR